MTAVVCCLTVKNEANKITNAKKHITANIMANFYLVYYW